jgi:cobyric acid synthase
LHGVFDDDRFRRWFIDRLRVRKGLDALLTVQACYDVDAALDNLAEVVRAAVDMEQIYNIMGLNKTC